MFKTVEKESGLVGVRIQNNLLKGLKGFAKQAKSFNFTEGFKESSARDIKALQGLQNELKDPKSTMGVLEARRKYLGNASQAAKDLAKSTNFVNMETEQMETHMQKSNVALQAQNKSFSNVKSIIGEYNSALEDEGNICANTGMKQKDFANGVNQSGTFLGKYLTNLNGAKGSMSGYVASLVGAKVATVALNVATSILNATISMGIGLIASMLVSGVVNWIDDIIHHTEKLIEAGEEAENKVKEISETFEKQKSVISESTTQFAELAQGVDMITGKNKSLSTDEYEAFLSISKDLAEQFSSLPVIYDENGNAIVQLNGNVNDVTSSLKELLEVEREIANQKIADELPKIFDKAKAQNEVLKDELYDIQSDLWYNKLDKAGEKRLSIDVNGLNLDEVTQIREKYEALFKKYNIPALFNKGQQVWKDDKLVFDTLYFDLNGTVNVTDKLKKELEKGTYEIQKEFESKLSGNTFQTLVNNVNKKSVDKKNEIKQNWSNLTSNINKWLPTQTDYSALSDERQNLIQRSINSLDYSKLNFDNWEKAEKYIKDHLLKVLGKDENGNFNFDIEKYTDLSDAFDSFKNNKISLKKYQEYYNVVKTNLEGIKGITDKTKNAILNDFNTIGSSGQTLDTAYNKISQLSKGVISVKDAEKELKNWKYDDISALFKIDAKTIKSWDDLKNKIKEFKETDTSDFDENAFIDDVKRRADAYSDFLKQSAQQGGINYKTETDEKGNVKSLGIDALGSYYSQIKGYDEDKLIERTAQGIKLNTQELTRLNNEVAKQEKQKLDDRLEKLQKKLGNLNEKINSCTDAEERLNLENERSQILDDIDNTETLAANYEALTSKYKAWQDALSNGEEGDSYDAIRDKLKDVKELYEKGLVGTNQFRTYVDLLTFKDLSSANVDKIVEAYENLDNKIKGTSYSVKDFLKEDEKGVNNFLSAMKELGYYNQNKNGDWVLKIADKEELAKQLGISTEFLENIVQKLDDYDFTVDIDINEMSDAEIEARFNDVRKKLKKAGLTKIDFEFDDSTTEQQVDDQLKEIRKVIKNNWTDKDGKINLDVDSENAEAAQIILTNLLRKKQEFEDSGNIALNVDVDKDIKDPNSDGAKAIKNLQNFNKGANDYKVDIETGQKTTKSAKKIKKAVDNLDKIKDKKVKAELGLDDKKYQAAVKRIKKNIKAGVAIDQKDIDIVKSKIKGINAKALVHLGVDNKDVAEEKKRQEDEVINKIVQFSVEKGEVLKFEKENHDVKAILKYAPQIDEDAFTRLVNQAKTRLQNALKDYTPPKKEKKKGGKHKLNGTAFARGNWGATDSGVALGGEVKPEIHVFSNSGRWELVGENSPEFFRYSKGDIIFDGDQTEQLLKYGKINYGHRRGNAFIGGTAFSKATVKGGKNLNSQGLINGGGGGGSDKKDSKDKSKDKTNNNKDKKKDTPLEKFKNWFSKLFDWIEIKLERQTDKISKYVANAERALNRGSYDVASKNYRKAIRNTANLIDTEGAAGRRYQKQANQVLSKGLGKGKAKSVISKKEAKKLKKLAGTKTVAGAIKKLVKNGKISIKGYSDGVKELISSYQEWYNKAKAAKDSVAELHENIRTYIKDLKDVRDAQRDAKIDKANTYNSIATNGFAYTAGTKNSQLNYANDVLLKTQNSAYSTATSKAQSDSKSIGKTAKSKITNKLIKKATGKYKKALKHARNKIKAKKKVADSDLKIIKKHNKSLYEKLYAYNLSFDNIEIAKLEEATNLADTTRQRFDNIQQQSNNRTDEYNNNISLYRQRSSNATSASGKNSELDKVVSQYAKIAQEDQANVDRFKAEKETAGKTISKASTKGAGAYAKYIKKAKTCVQNGTTIGASVIAKLAEGYSKGKVKKGFYEACLNYNNAIQYQKQAEDQQKINEQTAIAEKRAIGAEKISNIQQEYTNKLNQNSVNGKTSAKLTSEQNIKTAKGLSLNANDYQQMIKLSEQEAAIYAQEQQAILDQIQKNLDDGLWDTSTQEYIDAMQSVADLDVRIDECTKSQIEYNNSIINLPLENLEKVIGLLDAIKGRYASLADYLKAWGKQGESLFGDAFQKQIEYEGQEADKAYEQYQIAYENYMKARYSSEGAYGGKTTDDWEKEWNEYLSSYYSHKKNEKELMNDLRDEYFLYPFDKAIEKTERLRGLLEGIADFISEDMYYDKDGKITDYGIAQVGILTGEYENAREQVDNYKNELAEVNRLYAEGYYTADEYAEKVNDVQNNMLDAAKNMKSSLDSIISMYKEMAKAELDSLFKLIDARSEALSAKKEYYSYSKGINDKNSEIQSLQAQIAALETMDDLESKAQRKRLQAELKEKQDDLNETVNDHLIEISQNALDDLKDTLQDAFDDKWEHISSDIGAVAELMSAANDLTKASTSTINETLNRLLKFYGIEPNETQLSDVVSSVSQGHAKGTKGVNSNQLAWTQEGHKPEFIIRKSDGAILTPLSKGDSVIPNDLSNNLFEWGAISPEEFIGKTGSIQLPDTNVNTNVYNNYDSLIRVDGNVDGTVIRDLKEFGKQFYEGSYEYTVQQIVRDSKKVGVKVH